MHGDGSERYRQRDGEAGIAVCAGIGGRRVNLKSTGGEVSMIHCGTARAGEALRISIAPRHVKGKHGVGRQPRLAGAESEGQRLPGDEGQGLPRDADVWRGDSGRGLDRLHFDVRFRSGEAAIDRVGRGDGLKAERVQRGHEVAMLAGIAGGEGVVGRQHGRAIGGARESHRSSISRDGIAEGILRRDGEGIGGAGRDKRREGADLQLAHRRRVHHHGQRNAGNDAGVGHILDGKVLAAGRLQNSGEFVDSGIRSLECVVRGQVRLDVAAAKAHGVGKTGDRIDRIAIVVLDGDPESEAGSGGGRGGETADREMVRHGGNDGNPGLRTGKSADDRIRDRDRLAAGAP